MFTTFRYVLLLGAFVCTIQAEPPQSFLRGRVLDPARAPIADTQVTAVAISDGSKSLAQMMTDQNGEFLVSLKPGKYAFKVVKDGFAEASQVIDLAQSGAEPIEILLHLAPVRNMVTVTEAPPYLLSESSTATKTQTPLRDVPQSITVVTQELIKDQMMMSIGDVVRYVPGITALQGENNRDQVVIRGNNTTADFFVNGVRDDVQYFRDLYNLERVEALKGPNAMIFGRGGAGGVVNRVTKEAGFTPLREITLQGGSFGNKRFATDLDQPINDKLAAPPERDVRELRQLQEGCNLERFGISPSLTIMAGKRTNITLDYEHFRDNRTADRGIPSFQGRPSDIGHLHLLRQSERQPRKGQGESRLRGRRASSGWAQHSQSHDDWRLRQVLPELCPRRSDCGQDQGVCFCLQQRHSAAEHLQSDRPDLRRFHRTRSGTRC